MEELSTTLTQLLQNQQLFQASFSASINNLTSEFHDLRSRIPPSCFTSPFTPQPHPHHTPDQLWNSHNTASILQPKIPISTHKTKKPQFHFLTNNSQFHDQKFESPRSSHYTHSSLFLKPILEISAPEIVEEEYVQELSSSPKMIPPGVFANSSPMTATNDEIRVGESCQFSAMKISDFKMEVDLMSFGKHNKDEDGMDLSSQSRVSDFPDSAFLPTIVIHLSINQTPTTVPFPEPPDLNNLLSSDECSLLCDLNAPLLKSPSSTPPLAPLFPKPPDYSFATYFHHCVSLQKSTQPIYVESAHQDFNNPIVLSCKEIPPPKPPDRIYDVTSSLKHPIVDGESMATITEAMFNANHSPYFARTLPPLGSSLPPKPPHANFPHPHKEYCTKETEKFKSLLLKEWKRYLKDIKYCIHVTPVEITQTAYPPPKPSQLVLCWLESSIYHHTWKMTQMPCDRMKELMQQNTHAAIVLAGIATLDSTPGIYLFTDWSVSPAGGVVGPKNIVDDIYMFVSEKAQMNFDVRDIRVLNIDNRFATNVAWKNVNDVTSDLLGLKINEYTKQQLAALNLVPCSGSALATWTRAYGVDCGIMPNPSLRMAIQYSGTKCSAMKEDVEACMTWKKHFGKPINVIFLNVLALFGLLHLDKDITFYTNDDRNHVGTSWLNTLHTITTKIMQNVILKQKEELCRNASLPLGLVHTYWLAQVLGKRTDMWPSYLDLRLDVSLSLVQRIMIFDSNQRDWGKFQEFNSIYKKQIELKFMHNSNSTSRNNNDMHPWQAMFLVAQVIIINFSQFKMWDPGKRLFEHYFYNLEDKVVF